MGPLIPQHIIPDQWNNVIAVIIGMAFGFIMEGSGFSSSKKIVGLFYGYDFTVLKVFFTATVTAAIGILYFSFLGWIDLTMIHIHPTYVTGGIVGGVLMGIGFVSGGYCPGTSLCGVGIGRIDGIVFTMGLLLGIFLFSEFFAIIEPIYEGNFLGTVTITESIGMSPQWFVFLFTIMAIAIFVFTTWIRKKVRDINY